MRLIPIDERGNAGEAVAILSSKDLQNRPSPFREGLEDEVKRRIANRTMNGLRRNVSLIEVSVAGIKIDFVIILKIIEILVL